jgi:hypothetical protein
VTETQFHTNIQKREEQNNVAESQTLLTYTFDAALQFDRRKFSVAVQECVDTWTPSEILARYGRLCWSRTLLIQPIWHAYRYIYKKPNDITITRRSKSGCVIINFCGTNPASSTSTILNEILSLWRNIRRLSQYNVVTIYSNLLPTEGVTFMKNIVVGKTITLYESGGWGVLAVVSNHWKLNCLFI